MSISNENTFEKILDRMCKRVTEVASVEGTFIYTALAPFAMELADLYLRLGVDEDNSYADTADYEHLIKIAADRGLSPNKATHAEGIGKFDAEVPVGSKFTINTISFLSGDRIEGTLDGYFYYKMTSVETGTQANKKIGELTPITFIEGLTYAYLTQITVPAEDDEDIESFRNRYYATFNKKSFGGNKADYKDKINSINGVGGCKVYPIWNGGGTVKVVLINSDYEVPSQELINTIQMEIDPQQDGKGDGFAPIGHKVTIAGVSKVDITLSLEIILDDSHTFESIKEDLIRAIKSYFISLNKTWASENNLILRVAQITTVLLNVEGVIDVIRCLINGESGNLELTENQIPELLDIVEIDGG